MDAAYYLAQILEAGLYKTASVWLLASHCIKNPSQMSKKCCALLVKSQRMFSYGLLHMDTPVWAD